MGVVSPSRRPVKADMKTMLSRVMLALEDEIPGLEVASIEENDDAPRSAPSMVGETSVYYDVNVVRDPDGLEYKFLVIEELRELRDDILDEM